MSIENAQYLNHVRLSRQSPSVLRLRLAQIRADRPDIPVVTFEGKDDKIVYRQWFSRIDPSFRYEPLVGRGQKQVIEFCQSIAGRREGTWSNTFFVVDADFKCRSQLPDFDFLLVTDRHSIENYLVDNDLLDLILTDVFHMEGSSSERRRLGELFQKAYTLFLDATKEINWLLFVAARLDIEIVKYLPDRIGKLAEVELSSIKPLFGNADDVVALKYSPPEDCDNLRLLFDQLDAKSSYRGKFAMLFFNAWLSKLATACRNGQRREWNGGEDRITVDEKHLSLASYASLSGMPDRTKDFVRLMAQT